MQFKFSILFLLILVTLSSCSIQARINKADKKYELGEYYVAGNLYKRIYPSIPSKEKELRASVAF